jgi:predicted RNase H-like HicB family nuclease
MATTMYTAIIEKEGDLYAALCPELDVASQRATIEEATSNLREAVELFLECADPQEIKRRHRTDVFVTRIEAKRGRLRVLSGHEVCRILQQHGFVEARPARKSYRHAAPHRRWQRHGSHP